MPDVSSSLLTVNVSVPSSFPSMSVREAVYRPRMSHQCAFEKENDVGSARVQPSLREREFGSSRDCRGTKSFVTEKENFCRDDNRNFAPRDDMRP